MDIPLIECPECVAWKKRPFVAKPGEGATMRAFGVVITPEDRKAGKVYCSHLSYREWERQGFSLDWNRDGVGAGPEVRVLRKFEELSYRPGKLQVTYVILAPDIDRRPIKLIAIVDRESDTGGEFGCKEVNHPMIPSLPSDSIHALTQMKGSVEAEGKHD